MIRVTVELFGAFRQFTNESQLELHLASGASVHDLKGEFEQTLQKMRPETSTASLKDLIRLSAFADDRAVLNEDTRLDRDMTIAVLPPVCGG